MHEPLSNMDIRSLIGDPFGVVSDRTHHSKTQSDCLERPPRATAGKALPERECGGLSSCLGAGPECFGASVSATCSRVGLTGCSLHLMVLHLLKAISLGVS